jgi:hypothetical protein
MQLLLRGHQDLPDLHMAPRLPQHDLNGQDPLVARWLGPLQVLALQGHLLTQVLQDRALWRIAAMGVLQQELLLK